MKIIQEGKRTKFPVIVNCLNCSSKLEVLKEDVVYLYDDNSGDNLYIHCPVCAGFIRVGVDAITYQEIIKNVPWYKRLGF